MTLFFVFLVFVDHGRIFGIKRRRNKVSFGNHLNPPPPPLSFFGNY